MSEQATHPASVKPYILVFIGLAILTGLTVVLSYMGLPHRTAILLAACIAITKCTLIATYFMHLRFEKRGFLFLIAAAIFLVIVLVGSLIQDLAVLR